MMLDPIVSDTWKLQAWREDRALIAASDLISEALGQQYVNAVPLSMERVWEESATTRPVICLLSPGKHLQLERYEVTYLTEKFKILAHCHAAIKA